MLLTEPHAGVPCALQSDSFRIKVDKDVGKLVSVKVTVDALELGTGMYLNRIEVRRAV